MEENYSRSEGFLIFSSNFVSRLSFFYLFQSYNTNLKSTLQNFSDRLFTGFGFRVSGAGLTYRASVSGLPMLGALSKDDRHLNFGGFLKLGQAKLEASFVFSKIILSSAFFQILHVVCFFRFVL